MVVVLPAKTETALPVVEPETKGDKFQCSLQIDSACVPGTQCTTCMQAVLADPAAFGAFCKFHQEDLYRIAGRMIANKCNAEEIAQDALMIVWTKLSRGSLPDERRPEMATKLLGFAAKIV